MTIQNEWNAAIKAAIKAVSSVPVYVDVDGDDPDAERSAVSVRNDVMDALRALIRANGENAEK